MSESWHYCAVIRHLFRELRQLLRSKQLAANILKLPTQEKKKTQSILEKKGQTFSGIQAIVPHVQILKEAGKGEDIKKKMKALCK